jgi:hypothetical protein
MEMTNEIQMPKLKWQTKSKCLNAKGPGTGGWGLEIGGCQLSAVG